MTLTLVPEIRTYERERTTNKDLHSAKHDLIEGYPSERILFCQQKNTLR